MFLNLHGKSHILNFLRGKTQSARSGADLEIFSSVILGQFVGTKNWTNSAIPAGLLNRNERCSDELREASNVSFVPNRAHKSSQGDEPFYYTKDRRTKKRRGKIPEVRPCRILLSVGCRHIALACRYYVIARLFRNSGAIFAHFVKSHQTDEIAHAMQTIFDCKSPVDETHLPWPPVWVLAHNDNWFIAAATDLI